MLLRAAAVGVAGALVRRVRRRLRPVAARRPDGGRHRRAAPRRGDADAPAGRPGRPGARCPRPAAAWPSGAATPTPRCGGRTDAFVHPSTAGSLPLHERDERYSLMAFDLHLDDAELSSCVACGLCLPHCPTFRVDRRGGAVAARAHRRHAQRAVARRAAPTTSSCGSWRRACSAGAASRRARAACRSGTSWRAPARRWPTTTARRRAGCGPGSACSAGTARCSPARRCSPSPSACGWCRGGPGWPGCRCAGAGASRPSPARVDRARLALHRLRHGRLDARHPPRDGGVDRGGGRDVRRRRRTGAAAPCTPTPGSATAPGRWPSGSIALDARRRPDRRQLGRLRRGDEGLRAPRSARRRRRRSRRGSSTCRSGWRRASTGCRRPRRRLGPVIVQDPCHLRHVQRAHQPVRTVLGHVADVVELDDDGLCCGAGGAYSALQPELAGAVRDRKVAAIGRADGALRRDASSPAPTRAARCTSRRPA